MALKRERYPIPDFVRNSLAGNGLMNAYLARPDYQQNDYIGWITRGKRETTRKKRLNQMLEELRAGDRYMKMPWRHKK